METGETSSLSPSRCFAHLILLFALHLANLYEVPLLKCEGDGKGLQALFVYTIHSHNNLPTASVILSILSLKIFPPFKSHGTKDQPSDSLYKVQERYRQHVVLCIV